jgi:hypothetical protein
VAKRSNTSFDDIKDRVIKIKNPSYSGTCPEFTRLFDEKETYTGKYLCSFTHCFEMFYI